MTTTVYGTSTENARETHAGLPAIARERRQANLRRSVLASYKDFLDKSRVGVGYVVGVGYSSVGFNVLQHEYRAMQSCQNTAIQGSCGGGHAFLKVLSCGREYCPTCGLKGSDVHMQRYARIIPRMAHFASVGYFVIQWPVAARPGLRSRDVLSAVGSQVAKVFKKLGFARGIRTWDWFGDPKCPWCGAPGSLMDRRDPVAGYRCKYGHEFELDQVRDGAMQFNPHLNVLVEGAYLDRAGLAHIKEVLREALGQSELIVHYEYVGADDPARIAKMLHMARYVVKPSFLRLSWDWGLAAILKGVRSIFYWGTWKDEPVWALEEVQDAESLASVVMLEGGNCPACGSGVTWAGIVVMSAELMRGYVALGGGYWMLDFSGGYAT